MYNAAIGQRPNVQPVGLDATFFHYTIAVGLKYSLPHDGIEGVFFKGLVLARIWHGWCQDCGVFVFGSGKHWMYEYVSHVFGKFCTYTYPMHMCVLVLGGSLYVQFVYLILFIII